MLPNKETVLFGLVPGARYYPSDFIQHDNSKKSANTFCNEFDNVDSRIDFSALYHTLYTPHQVGTSMLQAEGREFLMLLEISYYFVRVGLCNPTNSSGNFLGPFVES